MYKVEIVSEPIQDQAIIRRRKMEEERKKRFFNSKVRTMGIDIEKIEEQIKKKNEMKEIERLRNEAFDNSLIQIGQTRELMEQKKQEIMRQQALDLDDYHKYQQRYEDRREFDLNDPKRLFKDKPARVGDDDPRKSVSGSQFFGGEDLSGPDRIKRQKEQMRVWALEQMAEKAERKRIEDEENKNFEDFRLRCSAECRRLQELKNKIDEEQLNDTIDFNKKLAELKHYKDNLYNINDERQNQRQIDYLLNKSILKEENKINPYTNRLRMDSYKGMEPHEIKAILDYQARQRVENQRKREHELDNENKWMLRETVNTYACMLLDQEREKQRKEIRMNITKENQEKAIEDKKKKEFFNKVLYTNVPNDDYYSQFNTTSR